MVLTTEYIEEIVHKSEEFNFLKYTRAGSYIDAKDTVSNWWAANVKEVNSEEDELNLHYDGWKVSYDEEVSISSNRIEPFRMITAGYTGQKNNTKREEWKLDLDDLSSLK